jgi:hypothetical protein
LSQIIQKEGMEEKVMMIDPMASKAINIGH